MTSSNAPRCMCYLTVNSDEFLSCLHLLLSRKRRVAKEADEMIKLERRQKQIIKKEEEERRKIAEEKMRRGIMIEMEEKTMQEAAKNMRVSLVV